mmetsp:Transcript_29176/g.34383  ORF Transcript_29176/g.34383 Transcript_29176/m.34383 type:complete len:291 (+) Transcript_29176:50-922(+)
MRKTLLSYARNKKSILPPKKVKVQYPLMQSTVSPFVYAAGDLEISESESFSGPYVQSASRYFEIHGPKARFVPPSEFSYELPSTGIPEIAFAGRSNVGKSTLLACLLGRKSIVRTSKTPGCTGSVNYFSIGEGDALNNTATHDNGMKGYSKAAHDAYLVDLPGYGFAKVSKKDQRQWSNFLTDFLSKRGFLTLRRVLVLIDSRRGATTEDWKLMEILSESNVTFQLVLTKADTVSKPEQQARVMQMFDEFKKWKIRPTHLPFVHVVSSKAPYFGIDELRFSIAQAAGFKL